MPIIELETQIHASVEVVFDLSRSIDLHVKSTARTKEKAIAGRTSGLIGLGEEVTWEARHFGVLQRLTTRITRYDRPRHFRDSMVKGAFIRFDHDHHFESAANGTVMYDRFDYTSPFGVVGRIVDRLVLKRYMTSFLVERNDLIKRVAESGSYQEFLVD